MSPTEKEKIDKENKEFYTGILKDSNLSIWRQYEETKDDRRNANSDVPSKT
jgi:hypothetical protein